MNPLETHKRREICYTLTGLGMGLALFLLVYGTAPLHPTQDRWLWGGFIGVDILQHYTGWLAMKNFGFGWPLTMTSGLEWPMGGAAALADCIPLLAVPFALVRSWLPHTFQYFGIFVCGSMMLQGEAALRLMRQFTHKTACILAGGAVLLCCPMVYDRAFHHTALCAHWLILYALVLYFCSSHRGFSKMPWGGFLALVLLASAIHIYFVPMVLAVGLACALGCARQQKKWKPLAQLFGCAAASVGNAWMLGFFTAEASTEEAFGLHAMNLNALFNPASVDDNWWVPGMGQLRWSRVAPILPRANDSLEAFNYLGLGLILGGAAMALFMAAKAMRSASVRKKMKGWALWHLPLGGVCLCLTLFALSNTVSLNGVNLFTLPLPQPVLNVCSAFRSCGRMFWPVWYLLAVAILVMLTRMPGKTLPTAALVLVVGIQLWDLSPGFAAKHAWFADKAANPPAEVLSETEQSALDGARVLFCLQFEDDRALAMAVARQGLASNIFVLARGDGTAQQENINRVWNALVAGNAAADVCYYTTDPWQKEYLAQTYPDAQSVPFYQGWLIRPAA